MSSGIRVTVLMPVHNGEAHLHEAIESILGQSFGDYEFLIIDDGSTDASAEIARSYKDRRIQVIQNVDNTGIAASLNKGILLAHGSYIARMDSDDISLPDRLAKQVEYLDKHPGTGICGTWVKACDGTGGRIWHYPTDHDTMVCGLIFGPTLAHPSVMMRKTLFNEGGLFYDPSYRRSQDYDLWVRASKHTRFSNINKTLMLYRINAGSAAKDNGDEKAFYAMRVARGLIEQLGITPSDDELVLHSSLSNMKFKPEKRYITQSGDWLNRLVEANKKSSVYPVPAFSRVLARRWFDVCASSGLGYWAVREYLGSPLARTTLPGIRQVLRYVSGYARSWS